MYTGRVNRILSEVFNIFEEKFRGKKTVTTPNLSNNASDQLPGINFELFSLKLTEKPDKHTDTQKVIKWNETIKINCGELVKCFKWCII